MERHSARLVGDVGHEILHVGGRAGRAELARDDFLRVERLYGRHAPEKPLLEIHHTVGIGEVAGKLRIGAVKNAGTFAEIARFERDVLLTSRQFPQRFAPIDVEKRRVGHRVVDHFPVTLDLVLGIACMKPRRSEDEKDKGRGEGKNADAMCHAADLGVAAR